MTAYALALAHSLVIIYPLTLALFRFRLRSRPCDHTHVLFWRSLLCLSPLPAPSFAAYDSRVSSTRSLSFFHLLGSGPCPRFWPPAALAHAFLPHAFLLFHGSRESVVGDGRGVKMVSGLKTRECRIGDGQASQYERGALETPQGRPGPRTRMDLPGRQRQDGSTGMLLVALVFALIPPQNSSPPLVLRLGPPSRSRSSPPSPSSKRPGGRESARHILVDMLASRPLPLALFTSPSSPRPLPLSPAHARALVLSMTMRTLSPPSRSPTPVLVLVFVLSLSHAYPRHRDRLRLSPAFSLSLPCPPSSLFASTAPDIPLVRPLLGLALLSRQV
ncbi:hypothetical protein OH77DRAFT_314938 [Trametes cingulata]|nr:hypothetical protein OH77DRAFT_314938 [Trametes cingulata]